MFSFNVLITVPHWACSLVLLHVCTLILILIDIDIHMSDNTVCGFVLLALVVWTATVITEDFAKPSGSNRINDVHLISREPQHKIQ